jgi:hypothetical protein
VVRTSPIIFFCENRFIKFYPLKTWCNCSIAESGEQLGPTLGRQRLLQNRQRDQRVRNRVVRFGYLARNREQTPSEQRNQTDPLPEIENSPVFAP